jgi:hypothetical protein
MKREPQRADPEVEEVLKDHPDAEEQNRRGPVIIEVPVGVRTVRAIRNRRRVIE